MYQQLARKAIQAALQSDWDEAIEINSNILDFNPNDTDALNRIAQAYVRKGYFEEAIEIAKKVIELDPLNPIASKCIDKCELLNIHQNGKTMQNANLIKLEQLFIEEPGKTKIISLINVCEPSLLASLNPGDSVRMLPRQRKVVITTHEENYIGRLPDDVSSRIIYLTKEGNSYSSHIKSVTKDEVKVFIREVERATASDQHISFPQRK